MNARKASSCCSQKPRCSSSHRVAVPSRPPVSRQYVTRPSFTRTSSRLATRPDQIFAHPQWGSDVCRRVNSPRVKVLFDIYHAQVMAGDLVANIREHFRWIGHFHTAGVPGRTDIDGTQEINYRFVAQAIADLGFTGYISHEFRPLPGHNPLDCIREAFDIIDV